MTSAVDINDLIEVATAAGRARLASAHSNSNSTPERTNPMKICVPDFVLDVTPGAREAIAKLENAQTALATVSLEYPEGVRPLAEVSRSVGDVLAPRPGVTSAEFDASRVAYELYRIEVASAERAVRIATDNVRSVAYGFGLDAEVIAARRDAAADRLEAIEHRLETAPLMKQERHDLETERVLAERYAVVDSASTLEDVDLLGALVTMHLPDKRIIKINANGIKTDDNRPTWSLTYANGRTITNARR